MKVDGAVVTVKKQRRADVETQVTDRETQPRQKG